MRPDYSRLPKLEALTTDTGRTYRVLGHPEIAPMRSITTALSLTADHTKLNEWKERVGHDEARRISREATDRGTLVHAFLEASFGVSLANPTGDQERALAKAVADLALLGDEDVGLTMAKNLTAEARKHMLEPWVQEIGLYSPSLGIAGRTDAVGEWDGVPALIDWKTSKKPKREEWITDYYLQGAFYAFAHNELLGTEIDRIVIGITCETGEVQIFTGSLAHWYDTLEYRLSLLPPLTP